MRQSPLFKLFFLGLFSLTFSLYAFYVVQSVLPHHVAFASARWVQVGVPNLHLREGPETGAPLIKDLYFGEKMELLSEQDDWMEVQDARGYTGWVSRQFVLYSPPGIQ